MSKRIKHYVITVEAFGLTQKQVHALFDRVADAAHDLDEEVTCSGGPLHDVAGYLSDAAKDAS